MNARVAVIAFAALLCACGDDEECTRDQDCAGGEACVARLCVARVAEAMNVAVELEPPADSQSARRDHPMVTFSGQPISLALDHKVAMKATLVNSLAVPSNQPSSVRVLATVPSEIPGRPDLPFEADGANHGTSPLYEVALDVPERLLGRPAQLGVVPVAPLNRLLAPWQLEVSLGLETEIILPGAADSLVVPGQVQTPTAPGAAVPEYDVRLFAGERLLSNVARTDPAGKFSLRAQKSLVEGRADVTMEVAPADPSSPPTALRLPYPPRGGLDMLRVPAAPAPLPYTVPVLVPVSGTERRPVAGATVRFSTALEAPALIEARYVRVGQTGADGKATLALLPGTGAANRVYVVRVFPPSDGDAGALCEPTYEVAAAVSSGGAPVVAALVLPRKAVLEGQIRRDNGKPAAGMRLRATRIPSADDDDPCGLLLGSVPVENTADGEGRYSLRVDPGSYRFEIEPPSEGGLPRHIIPLTVVSGDMRLDVALPPAVLLEGWVTKPADAPATGSVGRTEVRIYALGAGNQAEGLLGSTLTGADGGFRVVVPRR